ncbi:MAG: tetratricopeptide repeat protein [Rhodospirillales bacterium]|nr:tetratricopeptide repeat protein [Rhodospirillales bacterium]
MIGADRPFPDLGCRGLLRALVIAAFGLFGLAGVAQAAGLRGAAHADFGRLVFEWDEPVTYTAEIAGNRLLVAFDRPLPGDPRALVGALAGYLADVQVALDRKSASFTLAQPVQMRTYTVGGAVVVDLQRHQGAVSANTPAQGQPAARPAPMADAQGTVPVRVGDHDDFSRLVFDWPSPVGYQVTKQGEQVSVVFQRPGRVNTEAVKASLPQFLSGIDVAPQRGGLTVTLFVPEASRVRHFTSGPKVVVDILKPAGAEPSSAARRAPAAEPAAKAAPPITDSGLPTDLLALAKGRQPAPAAPPTKGAAGNGARPPAPATAGREPVSDAPAPAPPVGMGGQAAPAQPMAATPPPLPAPVLDDEEIEALPSTGPPRTASLSFTWSQATAAAVFRRAGYLWVMFDRYQEIDLRLQRQLGNEIVRSVEQMPSKNFTILRMVLEQGYSPTLRRENLLWILDLGRGPLRPVKPVEVKPQAESVTGPRVMINVAEAGSALPLVDPEMGDTIFVVPVVTLGVGVYPGLDLPEAEILPTAQGIAVVKRADGVEARSSRAGIEVVRVPGGLHFTKDADRLGGAYAAAPVDSAAFGIDRWQQGEPEKFLDTFHDLTVAAGNLLPEQRGPARLTLARFLVANGHGAEALGVLRTHILAEPSAAELAPFRAVRAVANVLQHRTQDALDDLTHPSLANLPEAQFWKTIAIAESEGRPERHNEALKEGLGSLGGYPRALKLRAGMIAAEAAVAAADDLTVQRLMEVLQPLVETPLDKARLALLEGGFDDITGATDSALEKYKKAEDGPGRLERAKAQLGRIELLLRNKRIERKEAIRDLERMRFAWRGDDFEFNLLRRLAELQLEEKDYVNGLRTLKLAVAGFREHREVESAAAVMTDVFARLYLEGDADALPPFTAIALYDEFKELTPVGPRGDEMIRKLADRLAAVDLLDRAAELLGQQVRFRLNGAEKSRIGFRQALLNVLDKKPEKALEALAASDVQGMPEDLERSRRLLKARALADLNRVPEALTAIGADTHRDALLLKAEIHWTRREWGPVAQTFEALVPKPEAKVEKGGQLTDQQARFVLNWAVALIMGNDERGLAKLRRTFLPYMEATAYKDAFHLMTNEPNADGVDSGRGLSRIKEVENFQSFMAGYRDRLRSERLSAIN